MDIKKIYIVSFGDSDEYSIPFNGSKEELLKSEEFRHITDQLKDCLKEDFPSGGYESLIYPRVREAEPSDKEAFPEFTPDALRHIKHHLKREAEVMAANKKLDRNAPFAETN